MLQRKSKWESDSNEFLRQKKLDNPPEYWSFFETLPKKQSNIPSEKSKLYDYFNYLNNAFKTQETSSTKSDDNDDLNVPIREQEIRVFMKKIKNGKSAGLDDVYPEFVKFAPDELILMITTFFNNMFIIRIVLDDWATSICQPIFKQGGKTDSNDYRGISLVSWVCKLFTSVLTERIQKDLEKR